MKLRVFKILKKTKVEGPNTRFCIWVQGCSRHCKGCWQEETWSHERGDLYDVDELLEMIKSQDVEGVTFLGGEPFEQAEALSALAKMAKGENLSVLTFTGNIYEDLRQSDDEFVKKLLDNTDLLIDGAFEEEKFDLNRPWVGSSNQRYIFLTDRYKFEDIKDIKNKIEVTVDKHGFLFINGMGDFEKISKQLGLQIVENKL